MLSTFILGWNLSLECYLENCPEVEVCAVKRIRFVIPEMVLVSGYQGLLGRLFLIRGIVLLWAGRAGPQVFCPDYSKNRVGPLQFFRKKGLKKVQDLVHMVFE